MTLENNLELPEPFKSMPYSEGLPAFIECWANKYDDPLECVYERHIGQELNEKNLTALYAWKNSGTRFLNKKSLKDNYINPSKCYLKCLPKLEELEARYLSHKKTGKKQSTTGGGVIFNIFYMHILSKNQKFEEVLKNPYPIFDQHVYRAWYFMEPKIFQGELSSCRELNERTGEKYRCDMYMKYRVFYALIKKEIDGNVKQDNDTYERKIDKALFMFGKKNPKSNYSLGGTATNPPA